MELELVTQQKLESYLQITGLVKNLTKEETTNFLQIAMDFNLNPFKREIYCTTYGKDQYQTTSIIIGYEVYIKRAERTQLLDGWKVSTTGSVESKDLKAQIVIYRKDRKYPFEHEVDYSEYVQTTHDKETGGKRPNKMWNEKPITMLKKVVTAQGFRLCFSDELGGMPYDTTELPGHEEREIVVSGQTSIIENPPIDPEKERYEKMSPEQKTKYDSFVSRFGNKYFQVGFSFSKENADEYKRLELSMSDIADSLLLKKSSDTKEIGGKQFNYWEEIKPEAKD